MSDHDEAMARPMDVREDDTLERLRQAAEPAGPTLAYGPEADQLVELFEPDPEAESGPASDPDAEPGPDPAKGSAGWLVLVHGGYFRPTIDRSHLRTCARALARRGRSVALAEYRREPGRPELTLADLSALDAALPQVLSQHTGRPDERITGWVGHSSGGALVLWRALTQELPPVRVVALAPISDLRAAAHRGLGDGAVDQWLGLDVADASASPGAALRAVEAIDPAHLASLASAQRLATITIIHGAADVTVPVDLTDGTELAGSVRKLPAAHHFDLVDPHSRWWPTIMSTLDSHFDPA